MLSWRWLPSQKGCLAEEAEAAIARLEAAQEAVTELQREPRGRLRITTAVSIGELFLAPVLSQFLEAYPAVEVVLLLSDRLVDLVAERFDVAIRAGQLRDSSLIARRIGSTSDRIVASAAYLARHGTPQRPSDLSSHACLCFSRSVMEVRSSWPFGAGASPACRACWPMRRSRPGGWCRFWTIRQPHPHQCSWCSPVEPACRPARGPSSTSCSRS